MNKSNWDDFRFILAVVENGSLNATAKALGVTHVTVMRRIAAFEERYGQKLFHKSPSGYRPLPEAEKILDVARNVEDAVLSVERTIFGAQGDISGNVRIASTDSICEMLMPKAVAAISQAYPAISVSVLSANSYHDLARLTADIAIRPVDQLGEDLKGDCAGEVPFYSYASEEAPDNWLGLTGDLSRSPAAAWMKKNVPEHQVLHEADSFLVLREMAAQGLGKTLLPSFLGENDPRLVSFDQDAPIASIPVWVVSQSEMYSNPRISAVRKVLLDQLGTVFLR